MQNLAVGILKILIKVLNIFLKSIHYYYLKLLISLQGPEFLLCSKTLRQAVGHTQRPGQRLSVAERSPASSVVVKNHWR
jgi:hypothetical protein